MNLSLLSRWLIVVLGLAAAPGVSQAQNIWKWRNAQGQLQVSDRPPPPDIPAANILQRPNVGTSRILMLPAADAASGPAAPAPTPGAASGPSRQETELEARRRKVQQERDAAKKADDDRKQADEERRKKQRAEDCTRIRSQLAALESGQRISRFNSLGEREVLDDQARAQETARLRNMLSQCQ